MTVRYVPQLWNEPRRRWEPLTEGFTRVEDADLWLQAWRHERLAQLAAVDLEVRPPAPRTRVVGLNGRP